MKAQKYTVQNFIELLVGTKGFARSEAANLERGSIPKTWASSAPNPFAIPETIHHTGMDPNQRLAKWKPKNKSCVTPFTTTWPISSTSPNLSILEEKLRLNHCVTQRQNPRLKSQSRLIMRQELYLQQKSQKEKQKNLKKQNCPGLKTGVPACSLNVSGLSFPTINLPHFKILSKFAVHF